MRYFQYYLLVATSGLHDTFTVESDVLRSNGYGVTCPSFNSDVLIMIAHIYSRKIPMWDLLCQNDLTRHTTNPNTKGYDLPADAERSLADTPGSHTSVLDQK